MNGTVTTSRLSELNAPRRNHYFYGKLLDVPHFDMEQVYVIQQRWLLNRLSLGEGVLCGLGVTVQANQVCISPGVAIDGLGREIIVPISACLNPWQLTDGCGTATTVLSNNQAHQVYICLAYSQCTTDYQPTLVTDCNTREQCSPGTIVETFCLQVHSVVPDPNQPAPPPPAPAPEPPVIPDPNPRACLALSTGTEAKDRRQLLSIAYSGPCLPQGDICVPLAAVDLMADGTIGKIDAATDRPRIYSNAVLLDLILCLAARVEQCCGAAKPCKAFPAGYIPFDKTSSTAGPDTFGDFVVVGIMNGPMWTEFQTAITLPDLVNQLYCDTVTLAPNLSVIAYVPSAAERNGDFSHFAKPLIDPRTGDPFANNTIPPSELPTGATPGIFAWRIRSVAPRP